MFCATLFPHGYNRVRDSLRYYIVCFQGLNPHNPSVGPSGSSPEATSRIVTNVSSQRFATSATSSGTTITFGRAPPNVTISNCIPPPLTKIMSEANSGHTATTTNVTVEAPNQLPIHAVSAVQTASVSVPPPLSSGSSYQPSVSRSSFGTAGAGHVSVGPGFRQATSPPLPPPRQVLSAVPGGVIRHPGVHPSPGATSPPLQVKQSNVTPPPPPPPLVPNSRVGPQPMRPQGMYPPVHTPSGPLAQPRPALHSLPPSYTTLGTRSSVVNHRPQGRNPPPLSSSSSGGPVHSGMGGERVMTHPGPSTLPHRSIMPNYHGISRSMTPGVPTGNVPPSLRFAGVRAPFRGGSPRYPPNARPPVGPPLPGSSGAPVQQVLCFCLLLLSAHLLVIKWWV